MSVASAQPVTRIVVPFAAGGVQDIVARSINAELGTALGRSVIVENRAGAGGMLGTAFVAKTPPDGYTVLITTASHTLIPAFTPEMDRLFLRLHPQTRQVRSRGIPAFGRRTKSNMDIGEDVVSPYLWGRTLRRVR